MNMRTFALVAILIVLSACSCAQCTAPSSTSDTEPAELNRQLGKIAYEAHRDGRFDDELQCLTVLSKLNWQLLAQSPQARYKYDLYNLVFSNDLPLAFLLEGKHRWDDAENIYRRNRQQLAHLKVAGNDIKSDNELGLAHLLFSMGKTKEAQRICSNWKNRVRHNSDFAIRAVKTNVPTPPL